MSRSEVVLREILVRHARDRPDKVFLKFGDGSQWTYADTLREARRYAARFAAMGVRRGDRVLSWLPNGPDFIRVWFGANLLGAVHAPCNLAWRGDMLRNAFEVAQPKVAVVHAGLEPLLREADISGPWQVATCGSDGGERGLDRIEVPLSFDEAEDLQPWDDMELLFTSGTTGPSKGVLASYRHCAAFLEPPDSAALGEEAVFLLVLPLFHAGGISSLYAVMIQGGGVAIPEGFKTDRFWDDVRRFEATSTTLVGAMASFLLGAPADDRDKSHTLRHANVSPLGPTSYAFGERFGSRLWASYGATEIGAVLATGAAPDKPGVTGWLREGYEARLVDDHDEPVAPGSPGELVIRSALPWTLLSAYFQRPDVMAQAWRNGWFHTGDIFRADEDGAFFYLDRKKDMIRRRGENISSMEVELALNRLDCFSEVSAYAVRMEDGDEEVMAAVSTHAGAAPVWAEVIAALEGQVAHFMIPRYFRYLDRLPRTESGKVRKELLREEGVSPGTWDREEAGIRIRARRID